MVDSVAVAPAAGAAEPLRQAKDANAVVPLTGSSSCPAYNNIGTIYKPLLVNAKVLGNDNMVTPVMNNTSESGYVALVLSCQAMPM